MIGRLFHLPPLEEIFCVDFLKEVESDELMNGLDCKRFGLPVKILSLVITTNPFKID